MANTYTPCQIYELTKGYVFQLLWLLIGLCVAIFPSANGSVWAPGKDTYHAEKYYDELIGKLKDQQSTKFRKQAILNLLEAAYTHNPTAEYYTGVYYLKERNYPYAVAWLTDAGQAGCVRADILLGTEIYNDGVGAKVDTKIAQQWLWRAYVTGKGHNPLVGKVISLLAEHFYIGDGLEMGRGFYTCRALIDKELRYFKGVTDPGRRRISRLGAMILLHEALSGGQEQRTAQSNYLFLFKGGVRGRLIALAEAHAGTPFSPFKFVVPLSQATANKHLPKVDILHLVRHFRIPRLIKFLSLPKSDFLRAASLKAQSLARRTIINGMRRMLAFIARHKGQRSSVAMLALVEMDTSMLQFGGHLDSKYRERIVKEERQCVIRINRRYDAIMRVEKGNLSSKSRRDMVNIHRIANLYAAIANGDNKFSPYLGGL